VSDFPVSPELGMTAAQQGRFKPRTHSARQSVEGRSCNSCGVDGSGLVTPEDAGCEQASMHTMQARNPPTELTALHKSALGPSETSTVHRNKVCFRR
jgi:hypothetical protein